MLTTYPVLRMVSKGEDPSIVWLLQTYERIGAFPEYNCNARGIDVPCVSID